MPITFPEKQNLFKRTNIFRTELFKFAELNIQNKTGAPAGQWLEGSMFVNLFDKLFYVSTNFKRTDTPNKLWLKFNGNVQDYSSKTGKTQVTTEGSPSYEAGKYGRSIELDGINDKLTLNGFNFDISNQVNISFWLYVDGGFSTGDNAYIFETITAGVDKVRINLNKSGGSLPYIHVLTRATGHSGESSAFTDENLALNTWQHIQIYFSSTADVSLKIDKGSTYTKSHNFAPAFTTESSTMGFGSAEFGDAKIRIDAFKIWEGAENRLTTKNELDYENLDLNHWIKSPTALIFAPAI